MSRVCFVIIIQAYNHNSDTCSGLPEIANLATTATFPINYGDAVTVTCPTGHVLDGDDVITCNWDTVFSYSIAPSCRIREFYMRHSNYCHSDNIYNKYVSVTSVAQ